MGLLAQLREDGKRVDPRRLITEDKAVAAENFRRQLIESGERLFDETYSRCLGKLLESEDPRDKFKAAMTLNMLAKVENFLENLKQSHGEAVVQANLGALTPRVLDVVRIFYPNQIINMLADVQPLDGVVGSIFLMKPRFSDSLPANAPGAVTAGDEMFKTPTYYYASEVQGQDLGTGNGATTTFAGTLGTQPLRKSTVKVTTLISGDVTTAVDDGAGSLSGPDVSSGTVDYDTGAVSVTFSTAPSARVKPIVPIARNTHRHS
jgi:Major capsid protein Gp23